MVADGRHDDDVSCCGCCSSKCLRNSNTVDNLNEIAEPDPCLNDQNLNERTRPPKLCYCCPNPFPRSQSYAMDSIPLSPLNKTDLREKELNLRSGTQTLMRKKHRRHPLIPSKTVVNPPTNSPSLCALLSTQTTKAISIACLLDAKLIYRDKLLATFPNKLASTGVRIIYFCDANTSATNDPSQNGGNYN